MLYTYPSYLGVSMAIEDKRYMPLHVLGMTNGASISMRRGMPRDVADFVTLHEEEHVKDMNASEREVDERALSRFAAKHGRITRHVARLMEKRHGISDSEEKQFSLRKVYVKEGISFEPMYFAQLDSNF